jgi:hypothetical protein
MRLSCAIVGALFASALTGNSLAKTIEKSSDAVWLERIEAGCKADAKKYYSAIQFKKRRTFVKHCVERAYR